MIHTNTTKKAAGASNTNGLHTTNGVDFPTVGADSKAIATQVAQLAMAGHAVHKGQSGDYLVSKYGMTRHCDNFAELQAFARQLGVKQ